MVVVTTSQCGKGDFITSAHTRPGVERSERGSVEREECGEGEGAVWGGKRGILLKTSLDSRHITKDITKDITKYIT